MDISRRQLLGSAVALTATSIFAPPALAAGGGKELFATARAGLERMGRRVIHHDYVGVADFSNPSRKLRFHVLDMAGGKKSSLLVAHRSEEHTSELQSLMRISYAVFCLKKKMIHRSILCYEIHFEYYNTITHRIKQSAHI